MQRQHSNYLFSSARFSSNQFSSLLVALLVIVAGFASALSPFGRWLEEDIGLPWLFKLRGEITAPKNVAVISIDQNSAHKLGLPAKPRKWPRYYHGKLVEQLAAHGATAIGFDIIFDEKRDPQDNRRFANGIATANNVVLFQYIRQQDAIDKVTGITQGRIEKLISPIPVLAQSARGLAPFPLPKVPAKVNHFILYKSSLGDMPTLPVAMLQLHARSVHAELIELISMFDPTGANAIANAIQHQDSQGLGIQDIASQFRQLFAQQPELATKIKNKLAQADHGYSDKQIKLLRALLNVYTAPKSLYLNFYGNFGSITTIPYYKVLSSDPDKPSIDVNGKAVFVGFSEQFQPEQKDGFYTVFTEESSGSDISGVEIIATAFANLLEQNAITVPSGYWEIAILIGWGLLISLLLRFGSALLQIPITLLLGFTYSGLVYYSFVEHYFWLPFLTPIVIQLLLASLLTFIWKYRQLQQERQHIREAFGYHLPVDVVDQIARGVDHVTRPGEKVHGIVMATDAQQYTTLSEKLTPDNLHRLMNEYYETIFKPIRDNHGIVSDVVGDAAMAIWASASQSPHHLSSNDRAQHHQHACLAALAAQQAINQFNQTNPEQALPTRFGLDSGEIVMGHVGALDHYEYRAIGDIVNTASRIEGVNKILGTCIIVSEAVLTGTRDLLSRELGRFKLVGKQSPTTLYELLGHKLYFQERSNFDLSVLDHFTQGLSLFQSQDWPAAYECFHANKDDRPSIYYAELSQRYLEHPPQDFEGYIVLTKK